MSSIAHDSQIRAALLPWILAASGTGLRVLEEVGVHNERARVDLLAVGDDLHAYEIKAARDNLSRLPWQIQQFSPCFDRITVACAPCHREGVLRLIPEWWGVLIASPMPMGPPIFRSHRSAEPNPDLNLQQQALLLWAVELAATVEAAGCARGVRGKSSAKMAARLIETHTPEDLRALLRDRLRLRVLRAWR